MKQGKLKRCLSAAMAFVMVATSITFTGAAKTEAADVIRISTAEELQKIGNDSSYPLDGDYILVNDIDLSGIDWTPIGGGYGDKGAASGTHVFSGTLDGQGYTIKGLSIQETTANASNAQMGLFGTIGSAQSKDYASVKNLVFSDVAINVTSDIATSAGALAGDVAGYVNIDNIAVENGTITATAGAADLIGIGGVLGEARTNQDTWSAGNTNINITNLYNAASVSANGSMYGSWCGGIMGRITRTAVNKMESCLNVGQVTVTGSDYEAVGVCGGDALGTVANCYYLDGTGNNACGTAIAEADLKTGVLPSGLSDSYWTAEAGKTIVPSLLAGSASFRFGTVVPVFADGETASSVTKNFTLPTSVEAEGQTYEVTWESSRPDVVEIQGADAIVHGTLSDVVCKLTATIGTDIRKEYNITVVSDIKATFDTNAPKVGTPLKVVVNNLPEGNTLAYSWEVGGAAISGNTDSYTPTQNDLEKFISCTVTIPGTSYEWTTSLYMSTLPVVYINTVNGQEVTDKENYIDMTCKIQGNAEFESDDVLYEGEAKIRGRGNYTWVHPKKPYKIKLDKKTSVLGMGKSKHWVLLANYVDTALMKNELFGNLWEDLDWEYSANAQPVSVILNGSYNGVYHISENVRVEESRVNIHDWEGDAGDIAKAVYSANKKTLSKTDRDAIEDQLTENLSWITTRAFTYNGTEYKVDDYGLDIPTDITGGYLLELDTYDYYHVKCASDFLTDLNQQMTFKSPEFVQGTNDAMYNYAKNYIQAYENAVVSADHTTQYDNKTVTYSELFDMESVVKYWLAIEITTNNDGMRFSNFMYKDIGWDKFKMGPVWDYDWTWEAGCGATEWQTNQYPHNNNDQWNKHLIKDPYFVVQAYEMYQKYKSNLEDMVKDGGDIDTICEKVKIAGAADMQRWHNGQSYEGSVQNVKSFAKSRIDWLNTQFKSLGSLMSSLNCSSNTTAIQLGTPDTTTAKGKTKINVTTTGNNITQLVAEVNGKVAGTFNVSSQKATVVITDDLLTTKENGLNTVQIFAKNASGSYVTTGGEAIWNYTTFKKANLDVTVPSLTGTVIISGSNYVNATVTATVTDSNATNLSYQWQADGKNIEGATGNTYRLTAQEAGKKIGVVVTAEEETNGTISAIRDTAVTVAPAAGYLLINQVYGCGDNTDGPLTSSFIELYNPTSAEIDLSGYKLGYLSQNNATEMVYLELTGKLAAKGHYLITAKAGNPEAKFVVGEGDLAWDQEIDNKRYQLVLYKGSTIVDGVAVNEAAIEGQGDALPNKTISKQRGIARYGYMDTNNSADDFITLSYDSMTEEEFAAVKPQSSQTTVVPETLTGKVTIIGTAKVGETVTAVITESNCTGVFSYQWQADGKDIAGANGKSYVPAEADAGKLLSVVVTSSVETGSISGSCKEKTAAKDNNDPVNPDPINPDPVNPDPIDPSPVNPTPVNPTTEKVTLNVSSIRLQLKKSTTGVKIAEKTLSTDTVAKWSSADTKIATVNAKGKITAKKVGKTTITVTMKSGATASVTVTVQKKPVATTKLTVTKKKVTLKRGKKLKLTYTRAPFTASDTVKITSSNKKLVKVLKNNTIQAGKKKGTAYITIKAGKKKQRIKVTVK